MSQLDRIRTAVFRVGWTSVVLSLLVAVAAEGQTRAITGEGEVSANDVYVRSGPSSNHYTICKLSAGDRVSIVSERGEWYEILPPDGAFSLISGEYVDTAGDESGVVNGNNVRVRAGSQLNKNKYTVQTMLSKGAEVTIIGREPDGFLRIVPPTGATLWISGDYVEQVPDELVKLQRKADPAGLDESPDPEASEEKTASTMGSSVMPTVKAVDGVRGDSLTSGVGGETEKTSKSSFAGLPTTKERFELEQIDAAAEEELGKPLLDRSFDQFLERYSAIAAQDEDAVARRYAELRCEQINGMVEAADAVRRMRQLGERTEAKRREFLGKRMRLPKMFPPVPDGLDAQGELRESALYPPERNPRRYRLIDPREATARTIGYVEIPADSTIDAEKYLGRYVGVRASTARLQSGGVDPIPIYVASELVLVAPTTAAAEDSRE